MMNMFREDRQRYKRNGSWFTVFEVVVHLYIAISWDIGLMLCNVMGVEQRHSVGKGEAYLESVELCDANICSSAELYEHDKELEF